VGTGVAGLYSALNLDSNLNILMITKGKITEANSYLAQGGISTVRSKDDITCFIEDTLKAGGYENDIKALSILAKESRYNIKTLLDMKVPFDKNNMGLSYTREGAHSTNRIVHCKDATGKAVMDTLISEVKKRDNITVLEDTYCADLIIRDNCCYGAVAIKNSESFNIYAKVIILATGGIGGIFKNTTNAPTVTGDGIAMALKNNIEVKDLNYVQFHPTGFYQKETSIEETSRQVFLISESLRGEGGKLYNSQGKRFVKELLPRDVVTEAILQETKKTGVPFVYLDMTELDGEYLKSRFPTIYEECLKNNIDITKDLIPVAPVQHYFMGGIKVDTNSKSSLDNLYCVGETSCTGIHGKNRLASNSLLEALVFSRRAALKINSDILNTQLLTPEVTETFDFKTVENANRSMLINEFKHRLRGNYSESISC